MEEIDFHLIGVGGVGMSALARLLLAKNYKVSGSDSSLVGEPIRLKEEGVRIYPSHSKSNINSSKTTVVFSTAISDDNPEIVKAKELNCKLWHRSDLLAYLIEDYNSIAITGTHGKTSTSALLSHVLKHCNKDPTYVIGGFLKEDMQNSRIGTGEHFVLEADESDLSHLKYHPYSAIITNLEEDHLDHYQDLNHIIETFNQFIDQVKFSELLFWYKDCPNLKRLNPDGISYGFDRDSDIRIENFSQKAWELTFNITFNSNKYCDIKLPMIGRQNALNAAAVFGLCIQLGLSEDEIKSGFKSFQGIKRRADRVGSIQNIEIIDDYAHHPTEVEYLLKSIRQAYPKRRVVAIFQPHRYSRFKPFFSEFSRAFNKCSELWLTDVFTAGEKIDKNVCLNEFTNLVQKHSHIEAAYISKDQLLDHAIKNLKPFDVVLTIGAGDITKLGLQIKEGLIKNPPKLTLGIIKGGASVEHYISLRSLGFFENGADKKLYNIKEFLIGIDSSWSTCGHKPNPLKPSLDVIQELLTCDVIVPVTHGSKGEDGMLQGFLKTLNLPFTGSDYETSSTVINKAYTKLIAQNENIEVSPFVYFSSDQWRENSKNLMQKIIKKLSFPLVVKPNHLGSSLKVFFVNELKDLKDAIEQVFEIDSVVLVENRIFGRELEVGALEDDKLIITKPSELKSKLFAPTYISKYHQAGIEKIAEADLDDHTIKMAQMATKVMYQKLLAKGFLRVDFFLTKQKKLIFNEANTIPGCTPRSTFPQMLLSAGYNSMKSVNALVINALHHHRLDKKEIVNTLHFTKKLEHALD